MAAAVREDLTKDNRKPILLTGEELQQALMQEKWGSPGELSAIEFRTLALHRIQVFAESEKLDKQVADKLLKLAARQWDCMKPDEDCCKDCCKSEQQPADWLAQFKQFAAAMPEQAKGLLTPEQGERLKQVLTRRFQEKALPLP